MNFENKQQSLLTFRVGSILCCAPSLYVKGIITPPKLTKPPGSSKAHPGIFRHDSHIVKVIDLRQKFGVSEKTEAGNLIIINFNNERFSFWVDKIIDVFDFPSEGWSSLPAGIPKDVFTRTLVLNENIHLYTEFEKLITIGELSYFKNNTQQEKEIVNEDVVIKEEIKEEILEHSDEQNVTTPNKIKEYIPKTIPEKKSNINTVTTKTKKPITTFEKIKEQKVKKQKPTINTKNTEKKQPILKPEAKKNSHHIPENTPSDEYESSSNTLFIVLILFIFISVTALYYLYPKERVVSEKQESEPLSLNITEETKTYEEALFAPIKIIKPITPPLIVENKPEAETTADKIIPHHAEIKKIEKEVVITVYTPKAVEKKHKPLIVHTVVRGDTLWAIAKKYINNPFRYSELAKLNKIKNPHRIYPGDQVQIRFIQK